MAAFASLGELSDRQQVTLLLSIMGTVCSGMFAFVSWLVKLSIRRELTRLDKLAKERSKRDRDRDRNIEWIKTILAIYRLVPKPSSPRPPDLDD